MFLLLLSSAHTASRPLLFLSPPHQQAGQGCTRSRDRTQPGQLTPTVQRDTPHYMASCSAWKLREWGCVWRLAGANIAQRLAGHQLFGSKQFFSFCIICFLTGFVFFSSLSLVWVFFPLNYYTAFISIHIFSDFYPCNSPPPPHCRDRSGWAAMWCLDTS